MNKIATDLEQSKKLAEILPIESADMVIWGKDLDAIAATDAQKFMKGLKDRKMNYIPCWSLAALLGVFDNKAGLAKEYDLWFCYDNGKSYCTKHYINAIDACYEMILMLHELNLL